MPGHKWHGWLRLTLPGAVAVKVTWFSGTHVTRCCDAERCCCVKGGSVAYTGGTNQWQDVEQTWPATV